LDEIRNAGNAGIAEIAGNGEAQFTAGLYPSRW
jgi:hypothetical protein